MTHINKQHYCTKCFTSKSVKAFSDAKRADTCDSCQQLFHNTNIDRDKEPKKNIKPAHSPAFYTKVKASRERQDLKDIEKEFEL